MNHLPKSLKEKKEKKKKDIMNLQLKFQTEQEYTQGQLRMIQTRPESSVKDHKQLEIYAEFTK